VSIVQVRQIEGYLEATFAGLIDMSDYDGKAADHRKGAFLSRAVAALALVHAAGVSPDVAAKAVVDGYGDNGIDAIHYDEADRLFYIVQSDGRDVQGMYQNGEWKIQKLWNGDETDHGLSFHDKPEIVRVRLGRF